MRCDEYPDGWGERPSDADDFVYVIWKVASVPNENNTQPYTVTIQDTPESPGEVVGYRRTSGTYYTFSAPTPAMGEFSTEAPVYTVTNPDYENKYYGYYTYVLTRYPKSEVADGQQHTFKNTAVSVLTGSDDGVVTKASYSSQFTWADLKFTLPPGETYLYKSGWGESSGAINLLENGKNATINAGMWESQSFYCNQATVKLYELTLDKNGNANNASDYGKTKYRVELTDDMFFLKGDYNRQLTAEDYEISEIKANLWFYDYSLNATKTKYNYQKHDAVQDYPDVDILGTKDFDHWEKIGVLSWSSGKEKIVLNDGASTYVDAGGGNLHSIKIPSGYVGVKLSLDTSMAGIYSELYVRLTMKPSAYVKSCVQGEDKVEVRDVNSLVVRKGDSTLYVPSYGYMRESYSNKYIDARDQTLYGGTVLHKSAIGQLTRFKTTSKISKELTDQSDDPSNSRVNLNYEVNLEENMVHPSGQDADYYIQNGFFTPQNEGTFYDLLPYGTTLDEGSVKAETNSGQMDVQVSYKENWRDSGRTMAVFHVKAREGNKTYSDYTSTLNSQIRLTYRLFYSYENMADFGKNILNSVAYETGNASLGSGRPDDGGTLTDKKLFEDLNDDGNPDGTANKDMYAQAVTSIQYNVAANLELTKAVKGPRNNDWGTGQDGSVVVKTNEDYQYRIRFQSGNDTTTSQIILFDALETYHPANGTKQWQGVFQGLDLSQPRQRGATPVIYYSTINNLDLDAHHDLTDTSVWTTAEPEDKSTIHAIAVDLRKAQDGSDFVLPQNSALTVKIKMKAPQDEKEVDALSRKNAHAYNNVYMSNTTQAGNEKPISFFIHHEYTQVGLPPAEVQEGNLKLTKISNGHDTPTDAEFTVTGPDGYSHTVKYSELKDGTITLDDLPVGTYTVAESNADVEGYTLTVDGEGSVKIEKDAVAEIKLVNSYKPNEGTPDQPTSDNPGGNTPEQPTSDNPGGNTPEQPTSDNPGGNAPDQPTENKGTPHKHRSHRHSSEQGETVQNLTQQTNVNNAIPAQKTDSTNVPQQEVQNVEGSAPASERPAAAENNNAQKADQNSPGTGDTSDMMFFLSVFVVSAVALAANLTVIIRSRRRNK